MGAAVQYPFIVAVKMVQRVRIRASLFVETFWSDISAD